jgi:hypothetical protein
MKSLVEKMVRIQADLKAPKGQRNTFGNYNYRSCEDIVEAAKPLLEREGLFMMISDKVVFHSEHRCYVEATVTVMDGVNSLTATASAREASVKKGMDDSQITGATSSYARKYALNGMFGIDDTKDSDATNDHGKASKKVQNKPTKGQEWCAEMVGYLHSSDSESLLDKWEKTDNDFISAVWHSINSADRSKMKEMIAKERKSNE